MVMLSATLALAPAKAFGQQQEMRREGVVVKQSETERSLFKQLLCYCGTCPHEPLDTCTCGTAHEARGWAREQLASGKSNNEIVTAYAKLHGSENVVVQADTGVNRAIWAVPFGFALGGIGLVWQLSRRWRRATIADDEKKEKLAGEVEEQSDEEPLESSGRDDYDDRLDAELKDLE